MLKLLVKWFIKSPENVSDPNVRGAYGTLCGMYGIFLNILLFAGKYIAGILSGSVAITADAFNNLSDAGSSIISLLGFRLASRKPDPDHPYGHGRVEYLSGLALSVLIIVMGVELAKTSFEKILHPTPVDSGLLPALILIASIAVKFYMSRYNKTIGKKINSAAMLATATDSLSDSISTTVVLLSMLISRFFGINIDGWAGLAVAVFICFAGVSSIKETIAPLLGQAPEKDFVAEIESTVLTHPEICGIHDLLVHDYGPGRTFISLHAEVDGYGNLFELHDVIDNAEHELQTKFGCLATIHLDPIDTRNKELTQIRSELGTALKELFHNNKVTVHDLRIVSGPTHTNLIFDVVLPQNGKITNEEASAMVKKLVSEKYPAHFAVVNIDRDYT